ncbi:MAG: response regulator [Acidobacteriota bacterium]|nr:response regulator [Acidobacteriota bacterium]
MNRQVLCIDDDESILTIRKLIVESAGFKALTASNGKEGLKIFNSNLIDAVVVDYMMPEMDGGIVSTAIKEIRPQTPVIMVSAYPSARERLSHVVDAFIEKGGTPEVFLERLKSLISLRGHSHSELNSEYVIFANASRRYLDCSDGVCKLLGYSRLEILEKTVDDLSYHPDRAAEIFEKYLKRGQQDGEYVLRHKNGRPVPIRYVAHIFPDGCIAAVWNPILGHHWKT